ncbi:jg8987 [Pararge aegeria aegeria]|uniref:Jg8987 protein n=1 Tax=Pararge aegeria aegeria TaxID=348720 RepID=A0A8S4SMG2_9NEOP|nr:jg8987 [Pararge aegeria aegeria]
MRLNQEVERKRPELINKRGVVFHHDNARPNTSLATQQKLREREREFRWEVLMHPPYSPDLAPSDFHLFQSLQNSVGSVKLTSREDWQNYLSRFFDQKPWEAMGLCPYLQDGIKKSNKMVPTYSS